MNDTPLHWLSLCEYDFFCDDFFYSHSNAVYPTNPFHLILSLELFRHALAGGVLLNQQIEHLIMDTGRN